MSSPQNVLMKMVEQQLMQLRTAFVGRVVEVNGGASPATASIQPVSLYKLEGEAEKKYPILRDVPVLKAALPGLGAGALVLCVCADRDISQAVKGRATLPPPLHHKMGDAIVVGVF